MRTVGRYEVLRTLGRGGMATVHLARQPELDRLVALKEMHAFHTDQDAILRRFVRESRLAGSLSHPNIVTVYDFLEVDDTPYIAMEYVEAGSLRPYLPVLSDAQRLFVLHGILAGLIHAEEHGVVHRDLKPENVLVSAGGDVKITDFGVAKATRSASTALTGVGMTVGTPGYMAPEQAMAQPIGPWTDLYAVGCMAYELFAGAVPFADSEGPMAILLRHVNEPIPPANGVNPDIDPAVSNWIAALTAREPGRRTQTAGLALESLEDIAISLLGPRWLRDGRLNQSAPPPPAPAPTPMPSMVFETYVAPAPSSPAAEAAPAPPPPPEPDVFEPYVAPAPALSRPPTGRDEEPPPVAPSPAGEPAPPEPDVFETYVAPALSRPPTGRDEEPPPDAPSPAGEPAPPPRDPSPDPTRDAARVDHAAIAPDAFLPGRSHYRGQPPQDVPTQLPRKPPPPQRDVTPPTSRVPPIVIAATVLVAIVIVAVWVLVA